MNCLEFITLLKEFRQRLPCECSALQTRSNTSHCKLQPRSWFYFSSVKQKGLSASSAEKMKSFSPSIRIRHSAKSAGLCFTSKKRTHTIIQHNEGLESSPPTHTPTRPSPTPRHTTTFPQYLVCLWSNRSRKRHSVLVLIPSGHQFFPLLR